MCDEDRYREGMAEDAREAQARAEKDGWPVRLGTKVRRMDGGTRFCPTGSIGTVVKLCLREQAHEFGADFRVNWEHTTYLNDDGYEVTDVGTLIEVVD